MITVVCPVYNSAKFVTKTLSSIILQSRHPRELIIVDDGSTDHTAEVVQGFMVDQASDINWRLIRSGHVGPGGLEILGSPRQPAHGLHSSTLMIIGHQKNWQK